MNPPASAPARQSQGRQRNQGSQGSQAGGPAGGPGGGWPPQPPRIKRHRTAGDVFKALGALLVLAILLGAVPFALVRYIGWPLPHHLPSSHVFNQPITPQVLLDALAVIVWLAWAQFAACVVVEFRAAVRGIGMPPRVPGAGPSQFLARQLVAALLLITASAASFVPNLAHLGAGGSGAVQPSAHAPTTATAGVLPGAPHYQLQQHQYPAIAPAGGAASAHNLPAVRSESGLRVASESAATFSADGTKLYRVKPPHGRHHDSLWEIAQRHLGDGRRYKEIYELNKDRVQPDGSSLTDASLIRPGWILMMPADAVGGDLVVETAPVAPTTPTAPTVPTAPTSPDNLSPAQSGGIQPGTTQPSTSQPGIVQQGVTPPSPAQPTTVQPSTPQPSTAPSSPAQPTTPQAPTSGPSTSPSALTPVPSTVLPPILQTPATPPPPLVAPLVQAPPTQPPAVQPPATQTPDPQPSDTDTPPPQGPAADKSVLVKQGTEPAAAAKVTQSADELAKIASAAAESASAPVSETGNHQLVAVPRAAVTATPSAKALPAKPTPAEPILDEPAAEEPQSGQPQAAQPNESTPLQLAASVDTRPSHRGSHSPEESQPPSTEDRVLFGLAASPLLAAGLLKAIGRHRRRQLWNRVFGRRPVTPSGDGAVAEESIRVGASEVEVWFLDLALRGLSAGLAERGQTVPGAYAVRLRDEGIQLLLNKPAALDDPAAQPPAPWFTAADSRSWNFPRPGIVDVDAQAAHRRFAPYPGLVTIGAQGSDRLMIDIEEARGLIGLDGPAEIRRAMLAALAVELATNSWSDRMTVTLVGFPGDLTPLAPARVRHVRTLDEILPSLEIEAGERAKALAAGGLESVLDGRSRTGQASSFPPHFVLISEEPHAAILARLAAIATTPARIGLGFVVAGAPVGATWQLTLGSDRRITAPALGIEARAQLLPEEQYAAVLGLFRAVCDIEGTDVAAKPARQAVGYGGPLPDEPASVYAALLGPLEVTGVEPVETTEPEHITLLNEALVFLMHHRDGVHPRVLAAALWPRGTSADVAEATFARLTTWLGTDPHGKPNLHTDDEGRLRLGPYVWSDWDVFASLQSRAMLKDALELVRGQYLADREPNRYGWLAYEIAEAQAPALIADTALQLADACIASGEPEAAIEAVKAGMRGSPDDEELWRGLLRATSATQDSERLRGAIEGLYKRTWYVHGVQGLHPRTEALVNELMPDWREAIVA